MELGSFEYTKFQAMIVLFYSYRIFLYQFFNSIFVEYTIIKSWKKSVQNFEKIPITNDVRFALVRFQYLYF
ncbi:hypothetical protein C1631_019845 [Chryseobacterium phosphatilyticum]|uniref:Uncharacterized protein n=1 Tax=Chryseobacterium phosphatilyticum TaxID=475075 RepID=A0A316X864_9FLAO|nr:hypothetical protein C1631_019845 [Chryseobacterium phosphatilyticum]